MLTNSYFKIRSFGAEFEMQIQILPLTKSFSATNARMRLHFAVGVPGKIHIINMSFALADTVIDLLEIDV